MLYISLPWFSLWLLALPIHSSVTDKLDFITNFGLVECLHFQCKFSPSIFNRNHKRNATKYIINCDGHYFDNILTYLSSLEEHSQHLSKIFNYVSLEILNQIHLNVTLFKIHLISYNIKFRLELGHLVILILKSSNIKIFLQCKETSKVFRIH